MSGVNPMRALPAPSGLLWAVVLAGGEGKRLRPLVARIHPDGRPKQYAVIVGSRSLLRQTLDRVALAVPPERTVVVTTKAHARFFAADLSGPGAPTTLTQPCDRGTAAGILLPMHWISWKDPGATVAVFPSDHFIADDAAFMQRVEELAAAAARHPDRILMLGARPDSPEPGYGWIEPGMELERAPHGSDIRLVQRFLEKPSPEKARACMERGGLWNTFVMAARVSTFIEAGRRALPQLHERFLRLRPREGSELAEGALERAYALAPTADFSQSVLAESPQCLAVSALAPRTWSDWGTPDRVLESLRRCGVTPNWPQVLAPTG